MNSLEKKIHISDFLKKAEHIPVVDVRSPSEYSYGHIPGAVNIPLFDDRERELVGVKYKNEGSRKAILAGLDLAGKSMASKLEQAFGLSAGGPLLVHCWRGGMRSEAMAWLFSFGGIETEILDGGYKSYRNHVLEKLSGKLRYIILGGLTGSGKTDILKHMKSLGHQVIDLEAIACHKGSAFGSLGQPGQPTSEHFANLLFDELRVMDFTKPVWLEDESRNIGSVFLPDQFYCNMQESPVIALIMDTSLRMPRLLEEYTRYPAGDLKDAVMRISKRLGGLSTTEAIEGIESGNFEKAVEITLKYYDKTYMYGLKKRPERNIMYLESKSDDFRKNAEAVLKLSAEAGYR